MNAPYPDSVINQFLLNKSYFTDCKPFLSTKEAAALLGVSPAFLERDRVQKATRKIPFVKLGGKIVKYRLQDLMLYLEQNLQAATQH